MKKKLVIIFISLLIISFSEIRKAEELGLATFYSEFQKALETAKSIHDDCLWFIRPSLPEIRPGLNGTRFDNGLSLLEQYSVCYRRYTKASLTLLCEKEKELRDVIRFFEADSQSGDELESMKEQLDFIVSARLTQKEKDFEISVTAYENNESVQAYHGPDKVAINREKLFNLSYDFNSCDKILEK